MNDYSFGNFVSSLRLRRGLSQKELGALVGVSNKAVSKWENGAAKPQAAVCKKLAYALGITLDELLACKYQSAQSASKGIFAMEKEIWEKARQRMADLYGENPPLEILERFETERLQFQRSSFVPVMSFFGTLVSEVEAQNGVCFARGEIGDSFIAWLLGASKANPLPPHYYCAKCKRIEFVPDVSDGWDLPLKRCGCGGMLRGDGHRLPFSILRESASNSYEYSLPAQFRARAEALLRETFKDSLNVFRVVLADLSGQKSNSYLLLPNDACTDIPPDTDTLSLDADILFHKYRQYTRIIFLFSDRETLICSLADRTNWKPYQTDYLCQDAMDALREGGAMQPYVDRCRAELAKCTPVSVTNPKRDLTDCLKDTACNTFSDLLRIYGLCHGSYALQNGSSQLDQRFAYREDLYVLIQQEMVKKGVSGDGLAVKYTKQLRRGMLAEKRMTEAHARELTAAGITPDQLEDLKQVLYLFPKAHAVNDLRNSLILAWFAVKYPNEFRSELGRVLPVNS